MPLTQKEIAAKVPLTQNETGAEMPLTQKGLARRATGAHFSPGVALHHDGVLLAEEVHVGQLDLGGL